jgi:glyoxylase-like metal-dependent hydrolase (beta-lactamase superfamily II)
MKCCARGVGSAMWKTRAVATIVVALLPASVFAQDARAVIDATSRAMGMDGLTAITYSGAAAAGNFGQSRTISFGLASTSIRNYTRTIDFTGRASHAAGEATPPVARGGPAPSSFPYDETIAADSPWAQQLSIWVTPWGFLRGAAANNATLRTKKVGDVSYRTLTWSPPQKAPSGLPYQVIGYIGPDNLVDRVETWVEHPIFGDMRIEISHQNYRDFGGVKSPTRIAERRMGMEMFVTGISSVTANPPDLARLMRSDVRQQTAEDRTGGRTAASEKLADGVYRLDGDYVSMAVEFKDHVVVVEAGENEARGLAIIAEVRRLFPAKRIRYVVNTHPHFDHAAGLPPFVAESITILEHDNSRYFLEASLSEPRTLAGDLLAKSKKKPKVEGVIDRLVLQDATRTLELHAVKNLDHSDAMLLAYLPKEKILFTADFNVPEPGEAVNPSMRTLAANIERLQLDFDRHVTVHPADADRPLSRAGLMTLVKEAK